MSSSFKPPITDFCVSYKSSSKSAMLVALTPASFAISSTIRGWCLSERALSGLNASKMLLPEKFAVGGASNPFERLSSAAARPAIGNNCVSLLNEKFSCRSRCIARVGIRRTIPDS